MGNNDLAVKKVTREIRDFEHGRIANSPISNSKVKRDLMKDLDELDTLEDDGLDHVGLKDFNCDKLVDGPTESNSQLDDICLSTLTQKSKTSKGKKLMKVLVHKKGTKKIKFKHKDPK